LKISRLTIFLVISFSWLEAGIFNDAQNTNQSLSVVDYYGVIRVSGTKIIDKNGNHIALHGMSLFWSQWGGEFYNEKCIQWLRDDWRCTIVRVPCGIDKNGYLENPERELNKVMNVIDACIKLGIYVLIDWHDHKAENHIAQSKEFFKTIAQKYGNTPNILYEIYNEPVRVSWSKVVKPYAEDVIKVIRKYDPDNLIIVGTPHWSQDVEIAIDTPINDSNVAYAFHFYSSDRWHKQNFRDKVNAAVAKGAPIFITEYGISEANGDGVIDSVETARWLAFVDQYKFSTCNWSITTKVETSSALKPGASPFGSWSELDLTISGRTIRNRIRELNNDIFNSLRTTKK